MTSAHLEIPTLAAAVTDVLTLMDDNTNLLDQALQGDISIVTTAGGTITVPKSVSLRNFYLKLTGTPAAGFNIDFPTNNRYFCVDNQSGKIATVRIAGGGGASFAIPIGEIYLLYIDGTDVINIIGGTGGASGAVLSGALARRTTTQSIPNGVTAIGELILWDTEDYDTNTFHDNVTNNSRLTIPSDGYYVIRGGYTLASYTGTGIDIAYITLDGATADPGLALAESFNNSSTTGRRSGFVSTPPLFLTAGQYVEMRLLQISGAARNLAVVNSYFSIQKVGS